MWIQLSFQNLIMKYLKQSMIKLWNKYLKQSRTEYELSE